MDTLSGLSRPLGCERRFCGPLSFRTEALRSEESVATVLVFGKHRQEDRTDPSLHRASVQGDSKAIILRGSVVKRFYMENVKVLAFDVFGTVVDYYSTIILEGAEINRAKGLDIDWGKFALAWRGKYVPSMQRVMRGESDWLNLDALHRQSLEEVLREFGVTKLNETEKAHLNKVWHRLQPWPDAIAGLNRLRQRYTLTTLSNGNMALLVNMAKHSGLPWDCVLSAELIRAYKPDPRTYLMVGQLLGVSSSQVMMVAAHLEDLQAAQAQGLKTAYVPRPLEYGPNQPKATKPEASFDIVATDFVNLAERLAV